MAIGASAQAMTSQEIVTQNTRAVVFLEVHDENGGVTETGSGFIVSHDGSKSIIRAQTPVYEVVMTLHFDKAKYGAIEIASRGR
jgi:hypothetical protein